MLNDCKGVSLLLFACLFVCFSHFLFVNVSLIKSDDCLWLRFRFLVLAEISFVLFIVVFVVVSFVFFFRKLQSKTPYHNP